MSVLLIVVLFGLGFAYLATQNTMGVNINLWQYTFTNIPLYIVALGSLLLGLFISWLVSLIDNLTNAISLRSREHKIHQSERTVQSLESKLRDLEIENAHLKGTAESRVHPIRTREEDIFIERPREEISLKDRLRNAFS
jgi:uncharacterized integral membrane protein